MNHSSITSYLTAALLLLILFSFYDIASHISSIDSLIKNKSSSALKYVPPHQQQQQSCADYTQKSKNCLNEADECIKVLTAFNEKNKKFNERVQDCQDRNYKNSIRNKELKARLETIESGMQVTGQDL